MGELESQGQPQKPPAKPGLHVMHIGWALTLVTSAAAILLAVVIVGGLLLLGVEGLKAEPLVSAATLFDLLKIAFAVVAGLGGLVALVVAYRRQKVAEAAQRLAEASQRLAEQGEERAHRAEQREATKLHNDRFTTASGQLGHDSPAVRLAGVHALAGLADDAPTRELRQTCIDVLCAYLRMPYKPEPSEGATDEERLEFAGLREVRHTIIRLIGAHLRSEARVSWQGYDLDFTGVVFDGGDFSRAIFAGGRVAFDRTIFTGGTVSYTGAAFTGVEVSFAGAIFSDGTVFFDRTIFTGSTVSFDRTTFNGSTVFFDRTTFAGGTTSFNRAAFRGSAVFFNSAIFNGSTVSFAGAAISDGTVSFDRTTFNGSTVSFYGMAFNGGKVRFDRAAFGGGKIRFADARFTGSEIDFSRATATGVGVDFSSATFTGGTVNLRDSTHWDAPPLLPPNAPPEVVLLPRRTPHQPTTDQGDPRGESEIRA